MGFDSKFGDMDSPYVCIKGFLVGGDYTPQYWVSLKAYKDGRAMVVRKSTGVYHVKNDLLVECFTPEKLLDQGVTDVESMAIVAHTRLHIEYDCEYLALLQFRDVLSDRLYYGVGEILETGLIKVLTYNNRYRMPYYEAFDKYAGQLGHMISKDARIAEQLQDY